MLIPRNYSTSKVISITEFKKMFFFPSTSRKCLNSRQIFTKLLICSKKGKGKLLSCAWLFATPWTVACTKLLRPWDFLSKNIGVGCRFLLQGIFLTQGSNPGLPHCRQTLYRLSHQGSPKECYSYLPNSQCLIFSPGQEGVLRLSPGKEFWDLDVGMKHTRKCSVHRRTWVEISILFQIKKYLNRPLPSKGTSRELNTWHRAEAGMQGSREFLGLRCVGKE